MKSLLIVLIFVTITFSLKYAPQNLNHLQPNQKPLTVAAPVAAPVASPVDVPAPIASNTDRGIGEKVKDSVKTDTVTPKPEDKTAKID